MESKYEKDMSIDSSALDIEWLEQPRLMMRYSKKMARAIRETARLKELVDVTKAEVDKAVRDKPEKFGVDKMTETAVFNAVLKSVKYRSILEQYNDALYEENMVKGAIRAIEHRREALENLVRLLGQQYFAGPKVARDLDMEVTAKKNRQERADKSISITRRK